MRRDPIDLLEEQAMTRLPELVPIRYGRMLESPFAFYRGSAALMAADLALCVTELAPLYGGSPMRAILILFCFFGFNVSMNKVIHSSCS